MSNKYTKIAFVSFGCKVNQSEIDSIKSSLTAYKAVVIKDYTNADIIVVNTCAVTKKAENDGLKFLKKINPDKLRTVVATGCLVELFKDNLQELGVEIAVLNENKSKIAEFLNLEKKSRLSTGQKTAENLKKDHTRAFIKIQDGCDCHCSYCVIPLLRGKSVSLSRESIVKSFKEALNNGYKEIVITGIHIGLYGKDTGTSLTELLSELSAIEGDFRIRLTSQYVQEISGELVELVAGNPKIAPHFHISLQSGSDSVLKAMNRHYKVQDFINVVKLIRSAIPDAFIGADIIAGFPGETKELFEETVNLLESLPIELMLDSIHVFPYSKRPLTPAASSLLQMEDAVKKERAAVLRKIAAYQQDKRQQLLVGKMFRVLSENGNKGHIDNFYMVKLPGDIPSNLFLNVVITKINNGVPECRVVE